MKKKAKQKIRGWLPLENDELTHYQDGEKITIWRYRKDVEREYKKVYGYSYALVEIKRISQ
jgi:hypothetical protein